jgi:hypothetical protein
MRNKNAAGISQNGLWGQALKADSQTRLKSKILRRVRLRSFCD